MEGWTDSGNAAEYMIKPDFVYLAKYSRALKNKIKKFLPSVANITSSHGSWQFCSLDASTNVYPRSQGSVAIKVLLIMYNSPGHPQPISIENDNISVALFPPNTTSLLQPLDEDIIRCVTASYTRQFLEMFRKSCYI
jgi:hypothetical protein